MQIKPAKKREFLEMDKPVAEACYHGARNAGREMQSLATAFKNWLDDITRQLAELDAEEVRKAA